MINSKSNYELLESFNEHVHGHLDVKKAIINLVNKSKIRHHLKYILLDPQYKSFEPHKILLVAGSGQGKTHLVEIAAKIMNFPLIKVDACSLNPTGATGGITLENLKDKIIANAKALVEAKEYHSIQGAIDQTVVFIDEIDKLSKPSDSTGRWNTHVQENFLTLFDNKDRFKAVSFIFAGAFTGIEKETEIKNSSLGFLENNKESNTEIDWADSVIKYGLIPELVGRLNGVFKLNSLLKEDYVNILLNFLLPQKQDELFYYNCSNFSLSKDEIETLVDKALKSGQGVRCLKRELNKIVQDIEFNYEDDIFSLLHGE